MLLGNIAASAETLVEAIDRAVCLKAGSFPGRMGRQLDSDASGKR